MPSLKDLKNRIKSVKNTQKITKAMKMVAAAKLRRAKDKAEAARPYAEYMEKILLSLASSARQTSESMFLVGTGKDNVHLIVVMTGDRGLCGAFNSSITRATKKKVAELKSQGKTVKLLCVGKKSYELLKADFGSIIIGRIAELGRKQIAYSEAQQVTAALLDAFEKEKIDVAHIVYNHFKSAISQIVTFQQIIPLPVSADEQQATSNAAYEYEPEEDEILADLLPRNVAVQLYKAAGQLISACSSHQTRVWQ